MSYCTHVHLLTSHFAKVWKGRWNEREVAVKELRLHAPQSGERDEADATHAFMSFQKEVAVMCKLQHPNLLRLYGVMLRPLRMVLGKRTYSQARTHAPTCTHTHPHTHPHTHMRTHRAYALSLMQQLYYYIPLL